jgi:hypothetical protein
MDIVEYAEYVCGAKLYEWQKEHLRTLERLRHRGDIRIVMNRRGHLFVYMNPKELMPNGTTTDF